MNKFNDDQIEVIKKTLKNQEVVWSKNKQDRQYYEFIKQCLKIEIDQEVFKITMYLR
jgi:hypothetical protein